MYQDDMHEFGLFVSGDHIRESVPWRLGRYGRNGALQPDQIDDLTARFGFTVGDLKGLSRLIGLCLDPREMPYFVQAQGSVAAAAPTRCLRVRSRKAQRRTRRSLRR
jgi:hypothetical protein